jgi:hypothetical protein
MSIYQIIFITEKELDEMASAKPDLKGIPKYACITKAGNLRLWPKFEHGKCNLFAQEGA